MIDYGVVKNEETDKKGLRKKALTFCKYHPFLIGWSLTLIDVPSHHCLLPLILAYAVFNLELYTCCLKMECSRTTSCCLCATTTLAPSLWSTTCFSCWSCGTWEEWREKRSLTLSSSSSTESNACSWSTTKSLKDLSLMTGSEFH